MSPPIPSLTAVPIKVVTTNIASPRLVATPENAPVTPAFLTGRLVRRQVFIQLTEDHGCARRVGILQLPIVGRVDIARFPFSFQVPQRTEAEISLVLESATPG